MTIFGCILCGRWFDMLNADDVLPYLMSGPPYSKGLLACEECGQKMRAREAAKAGGHFHYDYEDSEMRRRK